MRAALERADELDYLGCYISRFDEQALVAAAQADGELAAGTDRGVLHGIPIAVKDLIATSEGPTTAQSRVIDSGWGRGRDAPAIARLRSAGAVIIGKVTTMEYALGYPDPDEPYPLPRNPWNTDAWAGGSSSGCANGVAAGLFSAGIGTDTGGSIRTPAAFCGITGFMPTYGMVPMTGCVPLGYSLDRIGPMARTAADCAAVLAAIAGPRSTETESANARSPAHVISTSRCLAGLVIGVSRLRPPGAGRSEATARFEAALSVLAELGASTVEIDLPYYDEIQAVNWITVMSEAAAYHHANISSRWHEYLPSTRLMIAEGLLIAAHDYVQAQRVRRVAQRRLSSIFADVDLIATPTADIPAPSFNDLLRSTTTDFHASLNTSYWNPLGNPVLALPVGFTSSGLPLSMQLAGPPFRDDQLLAVGALYQQATDWHSCVPTPSPPAQSQYGPERVSHSGHGASSGGQRDSRRPTSSDVPSVLIQAGLSVSDEELRALMGRERTLHEIRDSLYQVAEADDEYPAPVFDAEPPLLGW